MKYSIWRILFFLFILIGLLGLVLVFGISFFFYQFNVDQVVEERVASMEVLSNTVAGPAWTVKEVLYPGTIENIFRGVAETPGTKFVRLINSETNTIEKSSNIKEVGREILNLPAFERNVVVKEGVFEGELIKEFSIMARDGSDIWIGVSLKNIKKNILQVSIILGVITTILFFIVIVAIFFFFRKVVINPLLLLMKSFDRLKNKDYEINLGDVPVIEIQNIFQSFNRMAKELGASQAKLEFAYKTEKKAREELESLDKSKDQFLLTTQHHLRTPLAIIKGYLEQLLKGRLGELTSQMRHSLERINASIDRLATLVNEFLNVSQLEVGKGIFNLKLTKLKPIIDDIISDLKSEIAKKNLTVSFVNGFESWSNVLIDPTRFREALYILIDNSVKYNKDGGAITISGETKEYPADKKRGFFQLHIRDLGIGVTQEEFKKLFSEYFSRGGEAEKINTTGKGIGLVLAKNIIKAHNGRIWVESEGRGKGSKFTIELPISMEEKK